MARFPGDVKTLQGYRLAVGGMLALAVAIGIGRFAFTPLLPMMQKDSGLTLRAAGVLASSNYVGYFLGALSAIWLRLSPAVMVRGSALAIVVLTVGMGMTSQPAAWLLLRGLAGVASAWALIFSSAWVLQQLAAQGKAHLGGLAFGGVGLGIVFTGGLCALFLQLAWTADQAWIALGVAALVLTIIAWPAYAAALEPAARPEADSDLSGSWRSPGTTRLIWGYGCFGFGYIIPATFLPAMARQAVTDPAVFAWAWPVFGAAALLSALLAGRLSVRYSYRRIWIVAQFILAAGVALPIAWEGMGGIIASALFVGGTFVVTTMAGVQDARQIGKENATGLIAAMTAAFAIGQILGPLLVSALADHGGGMKVALATAAIALVAGALAIRERS